MRPEVLFKLFTPITGLPGIGPRNAKLVEKLAGAKRVDLVWLLPRELIDRRYAPQIGEAIPGQIATLTVLDQKKRQHRACRQTDRPVGTPYQRYTGLQGSV